MPKNVNFMNLLKTLYGKSANIRRPVFKAVVFIFKMLWWTFVRIYVGIVLLLVVSLLILTPFNLTDDPIVNRWLKLVIPVIFGTIVGMRISRENIQRHRETKLSGLENTLRTIGGASAVAMEVHVAIITIFWQVDNYIKTLDQFFPDEGMLIMPPSAPLPVIAEFILFLSGLVGLIYITERAFIMQSPSNHTAKAQTCQYIGRKWRELKCLWDLS